MGLSATALKGLSLPDIFMLRKASGQLAGDSEELFKRVLAEVREGRSSTRVVEIEPGRWVRVKSSDQSHHHETLNEPSLYLKAS
jgi:hypothetical protein